MSLQRRITAAAAIAVAAVIAALGAVGYLSTRSNLRREIDRALTERVEPFLQAHATGQRFGGRRPPRPLRDGDDNRPPDLGFGPGSPGPPELGGAAGYFQFVESSGAVRTVGAGGPQLKVDDRVRRAARSGQGRFFVDETVRGVHVRVLTAGDRFDHAAVQVARPLSEVDHVLRRLLITYALLIGGGVLLAILLGGLIGRSALAPITRFTRRTETVSGALDPSQRLEETGAPELARLAASFNRTLDALEESVQSQRHLVADASHELRTPISALRSNIQIFLDAERLPRHEREAMQSDILAELDELTQLVSDVVELARGARAGEHVESFALDEVVQDAIGRTRRRAPGLEWDVETEPTVIENAPERVGRAVSNLLDNARRWSPEGGRIEVGLADSVLSVRDHGPGFAAKDLPHVFDRFYRAAEARRMPGSGLGLAIVRQAAEAHGGWVQAGHHPDGGALLRVSFGSVGGASPAASDGASGALRVDEDRPAAVSAPSAS